MYSAVMAVLGNAVNNWVDFDAWCLTKGFDPLEIPSRRLVAAAWAFLIEGMDEERLEQLIYELSVEEPYFTAPPKADIATNQMIKAPAEKWRAPEGWTPPGWDEKKSFEAATSFMNFNANPK